MNDVPQGFLTSSDCFLCVIAWNVPKPSGGCRLSKVGSKFPSGFFFMETQTPSKATSHQSLWSLQVVCMNFFDIVLDFILMDAFEDLESPPSSVVAVLRNRWLSDSFKETVNKLHVDASHSSSICFTYLTREWCASILLPGSGNSLLVCLESEKTSSHGELTCDHMLRTLPGVHASWHLDPPLHTGSRWLHLPFLCHIRTCEPGFSFWVFGSQAAPQRSLYHLQGEEDSSLFKSALNLMYVDKYTCTCNSRYTAVATV